jgi:hypothetical protein
MLLTTDTLVVEKKEEEPESAGHAHGHGQLTGAGVLSERVPCHPADGGAVRAAGDEGCGELRAALSRRDHVRTARRLQMITVP